MAATTPGPILKRSRFCHLFRRDEAACLFHAITLRTLYGGPLLKSLYDAFESFQCSDNVLGSLTAYPSDRVLQAITDMEQAGMLISSDDADTQAYCHAFTRGMDQYQIQHMYFIATTGCNLRCRYCFVEACDRPLTVKYMSHETAARGLDVFARLSQQAQRITMTYYGGEPLLNADVVYGAMRYVRELERIGLFAKHVEMSLLTNGDLVDEETVQALQETDTRVSVSIDGWRALHDAARVDVKGHGSFDRAVLGFRRLQDAGLQPGVSCTLNLFNIEHIEGIARFIAEDLKASGMGFNVLLPTLSGGNPLGTSYERAAEQLVRAFVILREYGIYEDRVMRRVRPFVEKRFHLKDCMGVGGQLVLAPDGRIGPCQAYLGLDSAFPLHIDALHPRLSTLTSEDIYESPLFDEWRHRFPLNMSACSDCEAIAICGGGCPYAAEVTHGSIWAVDERACSQCRTILDWMVWDTFEHLVEATGEPSSGAAQVAV
jgi:uncharacterized protein